MKENELSLDDLAMIQAAQFDGKVCTGYRKVKFPEVYIYTVELSKLTTEIPETQIDSLLKDLTEVCKKYDVRVNAITIKV